MGLVRLIGLRYPGKLCDRLYSPTCQYTFPSLVVWHCGRVLVFCFVRVLHDVDECVIYARRGHQILPSQVALVFHVSGANPVVSPSSRHGQGAGIRPCSPVIAGTLHSRSRFIDLSNHLFLSLLLSSCTVCLCCFCRRSLQMHAAADRTGSRCTLRQIA